MKKHQKIARHLLYIILLLLLGSSFPFNGDLELRNRESFSSLFPINEIEQRWVDETISQMTLRQKCGQMIISYASGRDTSINSKQYQRLEKLVTEFNIGGIIFFNGDVKSQIKITNRLQRKSKIQLLISADYERGLGTRLDDAVEYPHNMALGATDDTHLTYLMGKYVGREARTIGVHQIFAPLLDVNSNYRNPIINIRSFSDKPNIIAWHGNAFIKGVHESRVITTAKHFPGHGATDMDSHTLLPRIFLPEEEFFKWDLIPFIEAINAGVKSVMIGHLEIPVFDDTPNLPATFSKKIISGLLKDKLNFSGLVITDAMNMRAVIDSFNQDVAAKLAVQAGCDLILFPMDDSLAINGIFNAVLNNEITLERIDESVKKILTAKKWVGADNSKIINETAALTEINSRHHRRLSREIAEKAITLLKDENKLLPINAGKFSKITCITVSDTRLSRTINKPFQFEKMLTEKFSNVFTYRLNKSSDKKNYKSALEAAKKSDLIILPTYVNVRSGNGAISLEEKHRVFIQQILKLKTPAVIVSFGNPYIYSELENVEIYLCSYSSTDVTQSAAVNAIAGAINISGKLPIHIPNTEFRNGNGIERRLLKLPGVEVESDSNYNFSRVDSIMLKGIEDSVFPGSVLLIGHRNRIVYHKPFGKFSYEKESNVITTDAIFDLASVTKVIGTTSAAMILFDQGKLKLDDPVVKYLPGFNNHGKDKITIKHLLTHNSGLPAFKRYYTMYETKDEIINDIMNTGLIFNPGTDYTYSDLGMITMQLIIEKITGSTIDKFLQANLFDKLEMKRTMYNPPPVMWYYCVPTEVDKYWRYTTVKGKVHDENAYMLSGVAGHAGLFSTAGDLAKLMFVYSNEGFYNDTIIFNPTTLQLFTSVQTKYGNRGLGWDVKASDSYSSAGSKFSSSSFGHTGFTGTSVWFDKEQGLFVILLTNRVHPTRDNRKIVEFRPELHDAIIDAITYK